MNSETDVNSGYIKRLAPTLQLLVQLAVIVLLFAGCKAKKTDFVLRVVDADCVPVPGATVERVFFKEQLRRQQLDLPQPGKTDDAGEVRIFGPQDSDLTVTVTKPGWYLSRRRILLPVDGTIELDLKQRRSPVAMAVREHSLFGPKPLPSGRDVGFDFEVGDYVAPEGSGFRADLVLHLTDRTTGVFQQDWDLEVRFDNPLDGIQAVKFDTTNSEFVSDYEAPEDGYVNRMVFHRRDGSDQHKEIQLAPNQNYYFRVRSRVLPNGEIRGHYGKIYGDFLKFVSYFNPSFGDRRIEWDPGRNLLKPRDDRVEIIPSRP